MKKFFKIILLFLFFIFTMYIFFPKERAYYYIENKILKENKIIISNEKVISKLFGLKIKDFNLHFNGINAAKIQSLDFSTFIFYSSIHISNLSINKKFENVLPINIEEVSIYQNIFNPFILILNIRTKEGEISAKLDIKDYKLYIKTNNNLAKKYFKELKKIEGEYSYEYRF